MTEPMASPKDIRNSMALGRGNYLLLQDEPTASPLVLKGQGALVSLLRSRSTASLHSLHRGGALRGPRDEEEGATVTALGGATAAPDRTMFRVRDDMDGDEPQRERERRMSAILNTPQMRSMRLIGNSNPRYRWERYWKTPEQLSGMKRKIRVYYERTNYLIQQYLYIDRLLDSSLPHDLLNEYNHLPASSFRGVEIPNTISEEMSGSPTKTTASSPVMAANKANGDPVAEGLISPSASESALSSQVKRVKRTPKDIYRATETTPLFNPETDDESTHANVLTEAEGDRGPRPEIPFLEDEEVDSSDRIVTIAIYVNMIANAILLAGKIAVVVSVPSVSVLASLVDALLDFLSTGIVWTTTWLIAQQDQYRYPVGRRRLVHPSCWPRKVLGGFYGNEH